MLIPAQARLALAAVALAAAFAGGWAVNGWRLGAARDAEITHDAEVLRDRTIERDALAHRLRESNDQQAASLQGARDETNRLRDCMRDVTCGLRIAAKCPARLPQAASTPSVDPGAGAELDADAERAYFAVRDGINKASAQLAACQAELRIRTDIPRKGE